MKTAKEIRELMGIKNSTQLAEELVEKIGESIEEQANKGERHCLYEDSENGDEIISIVCQVIHAKGYAYNRFKSEVDGKILNRISINW